MEIRIKMKGHFRLLQTAVHKSELAKVDRRVWSRENPCVLLVGMLIV
jgi:hypothetical protein